MKNVLLKMDYDGHAAGTLLKGVNSLEADAIERIGAGEVLPDDKPEEKAQPKAEKAAKE